MEVLSVKSEEALKPIEDNESIAADLLLDLSTILIDILKRLSSYEGRKDSPALSIIKSLYLCEIHRM